MKRLIDRHPIAFVIVLMLLTLSPIMAMRDFSPSNELRYLNIVDEAIAGKHIFAFTNQGEPYADKPPFYFWLMMLCKLIFGGHSMYALSLLSFIPACTIICVMDKWLTSAFPGRFSGAQRAGAALLLGTTGLFLGMAVFLRMDMMMCMWIVLALWTFWKACVSEVPSGAHRFLLPFYTFMALFTKGPVGLLMPPLAILAYLIVSKRGREAGRWLGFSFWGIIAAFCLIWFTGAWIDGGKEYLDNLLFHQTVDRAVNSFHHKEPFWYYLWMIWAVMAPWCLATIPPTIGTLIPGKNREGARPTEFERFFSVISVTVFVMLSCFSSKLAIYLAPLFPFIVYLYPASRKGRNGWQGFALGFAAVIALVAGVAAIAVSGICTFFPKVPDFLEMSFLKSPLIMLAGILLAAGGIRALHQIRTAKGLWEKPVMSVATALLTAIMVASFKMPAVNDYIGYGNFCKLIPAEGPVYTLKVYRPENINVYLGRDIYDFGKDIGTFLMIDPKEGTLVMKTSALGESEELLDRLADKEVQYCGPYSIYSLSRSGNGNASSSKKKKRPLIGN